MFGHDDGQQQSTNQWQQPGDQSQVVTPAATTDDVTGAPTVDSTTPIDKPGEDSATAPVDAPATEDAETAPPTPAAEEKATNSSAPMQDLADIKQQALEQLSPIVGHLDQPPEEKFKTTMMMIQASDDQSLIPEAYTAAQGIEDEKVKAQALLDIVNEINYFTQKG